ncbi:hypothetical protein OP10G_0613 [Fimbriimonas ginsengisoli Gsoil 348]|uniref:Uncharacterized protein n=2 Tax=Fimbriimonas ginsengisoli TaxID=1005039 RepID=A0A068NKG4_FIMGI|nr:hypothetical protein OP10G_0613 [Fimbriimonas ginsengisoli Gsoil 348]
MDPSSSSTIEGEFSHIVSADSDAPEDEGAFYGTLQGGQFDVTCHTMANTKFKLVGHSTAKGGFLLTRSDRPGESIEFSPLARLFSTGRSVVSFAFQEMSGTFDTSTRRDLGNGSIEYVGTCGSHQAKLVFKTNSRVDITVTVKDKGHVLAQFTGATVATISTLKQISTSRTLSTVGDLTVGSGISYLGTL